MMLRLALILMCMTVSAWAFHEHTFEVFEMREQLMMLTINLWELLEQLEYAHPELRSRVYQEIQGVQADINRIIDHLINLDRLQHPEQE